MSGADLYEDLVRPLVADPAVRHSTMMGLPCVRREGRFFAALDRGGALVVKLPADRVAELVAAGDGEPFAPARRVFREWVAIPQPDRRRWHSLLSEAHDHAGAEGGGGFAGFGRAGLDFLAGLEKNNTRAFFDAHRATYERDLLAPSKAFVAALGTVLQRQVSPGLRAEPRVGGSLFRIANDLRFARDRTPYKPHLDLAFWQGPHGPRRDPSLILRIGPATILLGCGVMPRTGPAARFAIRDGFHLTRTCPHPGEITTPALVAWCAERLSPYGPLLDRLGAVAAGRWDVQETE